MLSKKIITAVFIVTIGLMTACKSKKSGPPPPPPLPKVTLDTVKTTEADFYDEYPGTVAALNVVELRPQVSGFISGVYFKDGDRVKKGQLLYSVDQQLYAANYQQAVAGLQVQQANLLKAQKDANRYHELEKHDAVATQLVDNADAALEVAKKQSDAARANISAVATNLKYTKVYAPFDGVIGISMVKPGAPVTAGQTILNTVSTDNDVAVDFNVDQKEVFRFNKIINAPQSPIVDSTFLITFNGDEYAYPGRLYLMDRSVNPQTGTIKTRLVFPNKEKLLIAGMNGTVRVKSNTGAASVIIPYKAVVEQLGEFFVYIPGDSNKVSQKKVVLGKQIGNYVVVQSGLQPGEKIVVEGTQNLHEGSKVQPVIDSAHAAVPDSLQKKK